MEVERKLRRGRGSRLPSSAGGGVAATARSSEASFDGADGVVWSRNSWATPPRLRELMWLRCFLLIAHPPLLLLRRGASLSSRSVN